MGERVYAISAIALGIVGIVYHDFATVWQPVPDATPYRALLACVFSSALLAGGILSFFERGRRVGLILVAAMYLVAALLWLPRVIGYPQIFGVWAGFAQEFVMVPAAMIALRFHARIGVALVGLCALVFGIEHFTAIPQTAHLVPAWMPLGQVFWAWATGVAFCLAGISFVGGLRVQLASQLLAAMLVTFGLLVWLPPIFGHPTAHLVWAGNAINLAVAGSVLIVADWSAHDFSAN